MTAKEYLRKYEYAAHRVNRLEQELEAERLMIDAIRSASDNDGLPHGNNISRPVEERAIRIIDKANKLLAAKLEAIEIRQDVFETVMSIMKEDGLACDVLYERYINLVEDKETGRRRLKTWDEVAEAVRYTWPTVRRAWHRGLDLVELQISTRSYIEL